MKNLVINQIINSKDFIMSPQELGTLGQKAQDHDVNILSDFNDFVFLPCSPHGAFCFSA